MVEPITEPNFIATLGLNWKLFLAQLVNFGIVLFVLWRWVFRPVGGALESRREKIEHSVKSAEEIEKRLQQTQVETAAALSAARLAADNITKEAAVAAAQAKSETLNAAKAESAALLAGARAAIETEKNQAVSEVKKEIAGMVIAATEKVIKLKLDEAKDRSIIEQALR